MQYLGQQASMGPPQRVVGPSTTQPVLFGVIGSFRPDQKYQALQQVFERPSTGPMPKTISGVMGTCNNTFGKAPKTYIPGIHHGMVPFSGAFMSGHGDIEVIRNRK
jgi:hypothetical protein